MAADYVIADSHGRAGVVVLTDSAYSTDTYTGQQVASDITKCRGCSVLDNIDTPVESASITTAAIVSGLLQRYGRRFTYLLAANGAYVDGARGTHRRGTEW